MKRRFLCVVMVLLMAMGVVSLTGCGDDSESGDSDNTIVVGLDDAFAPMGFRDEDGELVGFDIDFAEAVGEEMGMEVEFKPIDWDAKEIELEAGTIDCVWNGMSVTPDRIENMALSNQYLSNNIILMTMADSDIDVTDPSQLADLNIGTQVDSSALLMLQENEAYDSFSGNISEYDKYDTAFMDLRAGRIDVVAVDQVLGEYTNNNLDGEFKACTYELGGDSYAIGFASDNTQLRDQVNDAIKALIDSGEAAEISEEWFGRNIVIFEPVEGEE